ncbi:MAG TPA: acyl-CoA dehydrogenase family protein [Gammaproteobacteria bacterium]|nr:acyl-CoA dehydrogenase family protein [Gammaproteobacteria bacterium]
MDFSLTDEQQMVRDSVERFVEKDYQFEQRLKILDRPEGYSKDHWKNFGGLGWLGIPLPEDVGGFGGTGVETMLVMESFGRGMVLEPYVATVVLGGKALALGGNGAQQKALVPGLIEGELQLAFGFAEQGGRYDLAHVATRAEKSGSGYKLSGTKPVVLNAPNADKLIVSARTGGGDSDAQGISLFLVDADADGLGVKPYRLLNGTLGGEVSLDGVRVTADALLGEENNALPLIERVVDYATAAVCSDAYGAMDAVFRRTADYVKTRKQFGVPIGSFQVIQHALVDMFVEVEQARSMSYMVSMKVDEEDADERKRAVSAAKAYLGKASRFVGQEAIQLHGGIGMTDELDIGHYFRRLTMFDNLFGNRDHHVERFASLTQ